MKKALFMTVGTGVGIKKEKIENLAHGLSESIIHYNPDKIVFFGSKLSEETVESLKNQYFEKTGEELLNYEFIRIENVDKFDECFREIKNKIKENEDYDITIDYTSGTKTMTMSAALCSILYHKTLSLISGKRGENGLVIPKTEEIETRNLYSVYDELLFEKVKDFFNNYRFEAAKSTLSEIVELENKKAYEKLIDAYDLWDKFEHSKAREILIEGDLKNINEIKKLLAVNKKFISMLMNPKEEKGFYLIADLLNNAKRRAEEKKYDDAAARLYRIVELIAQCRLRETYGINTSDVDIEKIPSDIQGKYEKLRNQKGKIKLPLQKSYELLEDMKDELGEKFSENKDKELGNSLSKRNKSILAHGLTPITEKNFFDFYEQALDLVKFAFHDIEDLIKESTFPKL